MATRRDALMRLAAGSATVALRGASAMQTKGAQNPAMPHMPADDDKSKNQQERKPSTFNASEYATLDAVTELIIPRTETPGAKDAGVAWRIDQVAGQDPELPKLYRAGFTYLNDTASKAGKSSFVELPRGKQMELLTAISTQQGTTERQFFDSLKALTIEWYYRSEVGLAQELGFKGNTYRTEFPGCTHPEHWPSQKGNSHAS